MENDRRVPTAYEIAMSKDTGYDPNEVKQQLTRKQLIACIHGTHPTPQQMMMKGSVRINGRFVGGHVDKWEWNDLSKRSDAELQELYDDLEI